MPKKFKLDITFENESVLFGICSHLKDYRIVWHLNKQLELKFSKTEDFEYQINKQQKIQNFSCYYYKDISNLSTYYFLSNTSVSENKYLISEHKQANYLMFCDRPLHNKNTKSLLSNIKQTSNILTAYEINQEAITNLYNIISDIELHITTIEKLKKEMKNKYNIV